MKCWLKNQLGINYCVLVVCKAGSDSSETLNAKQETSFEEANTEGNKGEKKQEKKSACDVGKHSIVVGEGQSADSGDDGKPADVSDKTRPSDGKDDSKLSEAKIESRCSDATKQRKHSESDKESSSSDDEMIDDDDTYEDDDDPNEAELDMLNLPPEHIVVNGKDLFFKSFTLTEMWFIIGHKGMNLLFGDDYLLIQANVLLI